ncbi:MAG: GNAT family N-acetyltransferase [Clostridia bacterium]|nr:GNAT family N-acetyltransferase [Clostridia bacterium]
MIFETKRLILRPWQESDAHSLYEYARSDKIGPAAGWPVHTSVEESLKIIKTVLSAPETYAVLDKASMCAIGSVGLMIGSAANIDLPDNQAEIGYWIGQPYWGRGLIPEAVRELLRYAFCELNLEKVWCSYFEGNTKSKRVQEKCGFEYRYTDKKYYVKPLGEERTLHVTCITKESRRRQNSLPETLEKEFNNNIKIEHLNKS